MQTDQLKPSGYLAALLRFLQIIVGRVRRCYASWEPFLSVERMTANVGSQYWIPTVRRGDCEVTILRPSPQWKGPFFHAISDEAVSAVVSPSPSLRGSSSRCTARRQSQSEIQSILLRPAIAQSTFSTLVASSLRMCVNKSRPGFVSFIHLLVCPLHQQLS
jgi:hypothetical protein